MPLQPGAWKTFAGLFGIFVLLIILAPVQPLDPFLPWIALVLTIWVLTRKRVVNKGSVDVPTAPGEDVLLTRSSLRFYISDTMWRRNGGGAGVYLGRRLSRNMSGGIGVWNNTSTSKREEYLRRYDGGAILTDRRLFLVDGNTLVTRVVIPVRSITSISATGVRKDRITISWGADSLRTAILEFRSLARREAMKSASTWLGAFRQLTSNNGSEPMQARALG